MLSHRQRFASVFVLLLSLVAIPAASAQTYDVYADFSPISNPTPGGIWTYGHSASFGSSLTIFPNPTTSGGNEVWNDLGHIALGAPTVFRNPDGVSHGLAPANSVVFHPGPLSSGFEVCNVVWTAPTSGAYDLAATFIDLDIGSRTVKVFVNNNVPGALYSIDLGGTGATGIYNSPSPVSLSAGDTVTFAVAPISTFNNDSTQLIATVSLAPEPGSIALLVAAAALLRRRHW